MKCEILRYNPLKVISSYNIDNCGGGKGRRLGSKTVNEKASFLISVV